MERKRELKKQYLQTKPNMGIFAVHNIKTESYYIGISKNLKGSLNSTKFQLGYGSHVNKTLQKEWNEHGENSFEIVILDQLEYDKDESKTDYTEDLKVLKEFVKAKLTGNISDI